jgi:LysM repeat protein
MPRMRPRRLAPLLLAIALVGCDGAGVMRTDDGRWLGMSAAGVRGQAESTIISDVDRELGEHWRCEVAIEPAPYRDVDEWRWKRLVAKVELIGDGTAPLPVHSEEIQDGVRRYLQPKVDNPIRNLRVPVIETVDAARHRALVAAREKVAPPGRDAGAAAVAPAAPAAPHAEAAGGSTYQVQAGDTLAAISTAFYGTPQHWRRIADANPGVDPARLAPGMSLAIPPAP